jgi:DNA polymerase-4
MRSIVELVLRQRADHTVERAGLAPSLDRFRSLLSEAFARTGKSVRLIGLGVRFASSERDETQLPLFV